MGHDYREFYKVMCARDKTKKETNKELYMDEVQHLPRKRLVGDLLKPGRSTCRARDQTLCCEQSGFII